MNHSHIFHEWTAYKMYTKIQQQKINNLQQPKNYGMHTKLRL